MCKPEFDPKDLTKEKSLWDIYLVSRRIPASKFNIITTLMVFFALIVNSWLTTQPIIETIGIVRNQAGNGLVISLNALGFLLAGFTIFATVSQPNLFLRMGEIRHPNSDLSYLKHNYFIFLRVFIFYLTFAVFCLLIVMFGHKGGFVSLLVSFSPYSDNVKFAVVKVSYILLFSGYYFLIMQLKSFVFNIYHAVMTSLRWKAEGYD